LEKRGGSIQAALNLEFEDLNIEKFNIKIEGEDGRLVNLDYFNTIIRICKTLQFKCGMDSEIIQTDYTRYSYERRDPTDYMINIRNTFNMIFKQATGITKSLHGTFLNYRIEAITISSSKLVSGSSNKKIFRQNILKSIRIIEGTLRSLNNLLERFHQSFFFYLLPTSSNYISIGMYMPSIGLICVPSIISIFYILNLFLYYTLLLF
jgi:GPI-anchor transamidase subunit GAA1